MEASTGIEPVYTDLQSTRLTNHFNALRAKKYQDKAKTNAEPDTAKKQVSFGAMIAPAHKSVSRMIGYCLTLGGDAWFGFRTVLCARLTEEERAAIAYQALTSLEPDNAEQVVMAAIQPRGTPLPPFLGGMSDARMWAASATRNELKAVAVAAVEAMSFKDQCTFRRHISEVGI